MLKIHDTVIYRIVVIYLLKATSCSEFCKQIFFCHSWYVFYILPIHFWWSVTNRCIFFPYVNPKDYVRHAVFYALLTAKIWFEKEVWEGIYVSLSFHVFFAAAGVKWPFNGVGVFSLRIWGVGCQLVELFTEANSSFLLLNHKTEPGSVQPHSM
jgi:hypothetical protein